MPRDVRYRSVCIVTMKSPRLLELFSGTGSVGKVAKGLPEGFEVTSVDINKKANPTILTDILKWDYKQFEPGHFDVIWASPPCNTFSHMVMCQIGRPCKEYPGEVWSKELILRRQEEKGVPGKGEFSLKIVSQIIIIPRVRVGHGIQSRGLRAASGVLRHGRCV